MHGSERRREDTSTRVLGLVQSATVNVHTWPYDAGARARGTLALLALSIHHARVDRAALLGLVRNASGWSNKGMLAFLDASGANFGKLGRLMIFILF